jgi:hypothetical protein
MPPRGRRLRAAAQQGTACRSRPRLNGSASRFCGVAQRRTADRRSPRKRRIAVVTANGDGAVTNRDVELRAAAYGVGIDHSAPDQGGCRCVIRVLLPTI